MAQTVAVPPETIEEILTRLDRLTKEVRIIKRRLFAKEPPYGSDEWWQWSDNKAREDIRAGKVLRFDSAAEAIKWLNS